MESNNIIISPICCFIGHVDAGKTLLLDYLRKSNIQDNEVGKITQQIGSTFFNREYLNEITGGLSKSLDIPGILILDTPGHNCFTQMRLVGIKVSHLPILVVDIIKGLEEQTKHCIELLLKYKKQFVIALNKLDKIPGWKSFDKKNSDKISDKKNSDKISDNNLRNLKNAFNRQDERVMSSMKKYTNRIVCQIAELGINAALYYENKDPKNTISMVPVSAKIGDGITDLILLISKLTSKNLTDMLQDKNSLYQHTFGYIIETKQDEKYGLLVYALLLANNLKKDDKIYIESLHGSIISTVVKDIFLPPNYTEMKNKTSFKSVQFINGTKGIGIKFEDDIYADIAPGGIFMNNKIRISEEIKDNEKMYETFNYDKIGVIINVPAKNMGYAILKLIQNENIKIQGINVGNIDKVTIIKVSSHLTSLKSLDYLYNKRYAVILDYNNLYTNDIKYGEDISKLSEKMDVKIINGNIIHNIIDAYRKYIEQIENQMIELCPSLVSNYKLQIIPKFIILKKSPLMFGIQVLSGTIRTGTVICARKDNDQFQSKLRLGTLTSIQKRNKPIDVANKDDKVCIRIEEDNDKNYEYGKDFDEKWILEPYMNDHEVEIKEKYFS